MKDKTPTHYFIIGSVNNGSCHVVYRRIGDCRDNPAKLAERPGPSSTVSQRVGALVSAK